MKRLLPKYCVLFLFLFSFVFLLPILNKVLAASVTLNATADSMINSSNSNSNYGNNSHLDVARTTPPQTSKKIRVLVKFDLSSIPSNATIDSATFSIYLYGCGSYSQTIDDMNIARITADWEEDDVTWNTHKGKFDTSNALNKTADCALDDQYHNYGIKSFVDNWRDGTWSNYGIGMYGDEAPSESWIKFFAGKEDSGRPHPRLVITYSMPTDGSGTGDTPTSQTNTGGNTSETSEETTDGSNKDKSATDSADATSSAEKTSTTSSTKENQDGSNRGLKIILIGTLIALLVATGIGLYILRKKRLLFFKNLPKDKGPQTKTPAEKTST